MLLAERCGLSTNYIGQIEMGRRLPSFEGIEKLAEALHIEPYLLFQQEDRKEPDKTSPATAKNLLEEMPPRIRKEICKRLLREIHDSIDNSFDPETY